MTKPSKSPPNSDLDGVDEDALRNPDAAIAADLARARGEAAARPDFSKEPGRDDRSR